MTRSAPPQASMEITMGKYNDIVALFEYMDRRHKPQANHRSKGRFNFKLNKTDMDIVASIKKKREEADLLEKYLKESSDKSKKLEGAVRNLTGLEWFLLGIMLYPVIGYLHALVPTVLK